MDLREICERKKVSYGSVYWQALALMLGPWTFIAEF